MISVKKIGRLAALAVAFSAAGMVEASGPHRLRSDADIEELDAEIGRIGGQWLLRVSFEVEVEDLRHGERFEAVLRLSDGRRPLLDETGQPLTIVVPLQRAVEIDDDEVTFADVVTIRLPLHMVRRPDRLEVQMLVVRVNDGRVLDKDDESFDARKKKHRRPIPRRRDRRW